jgi:hypothetical protein
MEKNVTKVNEAITNVLNNFGLRRNVVCVKELDFSGAVSERVKLFLKKGEVYKVKGLNNCCYRGCYDYNITAQMEFDGKSSEKDIWVSQWNFSDIANEPIVKALSMMSNPLNLRLLGSYRLAMRFKIGMKYGYECKIDLAELEVGQVVRVGSSKECEVNTYVGNDGNEYPFLKEFVKPIQAIVVRNSETQWYVFDASGEGLSYLVFD